jgi:hypothetical protein
MLLTEVLRKHGVTPFVWRKETLTWRYLFMIGQEQGTCPWQPGLGFVYMKPGETRCKPGGLGFLSETRRVHVLFMKLRRLEQEHCFSGGGHCFPGMETLLAFHNCLFVLFISWMQKYPLDNCLVCSFLPWALSGQGLLRFWQEWVREMGRRMNTLQIMYVHVCKCKNDTCWNCSMYQRRGG